MKRFVYFLRNLGIGIGILAAIALLAIWLEPQWLIDLIETNEIASKAFGAIPLVVIGYCWVKSGEQADQSGKKSGED